MGTIYDGRPKVEHKFIDGIEYKRCTKCDAWKPLDSFNRKKDMSDGLRNACRECQRKDGKKYRERNKEKERLRGKINRSNPSYQKWIREYQYKWWRVNRNKRQLYHQKRKASALNLPDTLTDLEWEAIKNKFNNSCAYCGKTECSLQYEHFTPISKDTKWGTSKENIIPACPSCNYSKKNHDFNIWYPQQEFYSEGKYNFIIAHIADMRGQNKDTLKLDWEQLSLF